MRVDCYPMTEQTACLSSHHIPGGRARHTAACRSWPDFQKTPSCNKVCASREKFMRPKSVLLAMQTFLLIGGLAVAQTATSRITGTVSDASGALVPGAMVTAKNDATGVAYTQTTTEVGLYGFPSLPAGLYTISVSLP